MLELLLLIVVLLLGGYVSSLGTRVKKLEEKLGLKDAPAPMYSTEALQSMATQAPVQSQPAVVSVIPPVQVPQYQPVAMASQAEAESKFIRFFKEDFLVKLGALLLLFAFGWGVSYAFANNWIGPVGRIALGLGAGVLILGFATFWLRKNFHQAAIFLVLGLSIFNLTIFAARFIYDFLNPGVALALMFIAVAYVAVRAVEYNSQNLAGACLAFAGIAPLFTAGEPSIGGLFSYLLVFVAGIIWIVYVRGWHMLTLASLLVVTFYSVPYLFESDLAGDMMALGFANLFAFIFFAFNYVSIVRGGAQVSGVHIGTALGSGLFLIAWILTATEGILESTLSMLWAVGLLLLAGSILQFRGIMQAFYLYSSVGLLFLAVATASVFDGPVLALAYTIETGLVVLLTQIILSKPHITRNVCFLFAGPMLLSITSFVSSAWNGSVLHNDFLVILTLTAVLAVVGMVLRGIAMRDTAQTSLLETANALLSLGVLYGLGLIIRSVQSQYESDVTAIVFIIASGALVTLMHAIYLQKELTAKVAYVLSIGALIALMSTQSSAWNSGFLHNEFFIMLSFSAVALLVGFFLKYLNQVSDPSSEVMVAYRTILYAGGVCLLWLVWLVLHASTLSEDVATTLSLIIYTVCGLGFYVYGRMHKIAHYQYAGGIVLGFVVMRLLLIDVWRMELLERIVTFFMVGILLISTAFYGRKKKDQSLPQ